MIEWLDTHIVYWHWVVFGLLLAASEIFVPAFFMLWLGVSAIAVGVILSVVSISFSTQLLVWIILSMICLVTWFKYISPMMHDRSLSGMAMEKLLGNEGTVTDYNNITNRGRMKFPAPIVGSDEWEIICNVDLTPGDRVVIVDLSGNSLIVKKK